ncbi:glycosyltransferase family 2 protein [Escherichia coli]|nr:glycosyltransferase family 2 protein [Escherichia coli]
MKNNIALVLVTYNRESLLKEVLSSIKHLKDKPKHVYIIDNNSSDGTCNIIIDFIQQNSSILSMSYHNTGDNLGGAGGFAYGSRLAYADGFQWIWLADDDVVFEQTCLTQLMLYSSDADILQPMRINTDGSCAEISGIDYEINNIFRLNPKKLKITDIYEEKWDIQEIKTIPFEGPLIHRRVFEQIGFPNPDFFIFYDDLDFALRAQRAGFKIKCVKSAHLIRKIRFVQSVALTSWKGYFMYRNFFKVQLTYARIPIGLFRVIAIFFIVIIYSLLFGCAKNISTLISALRDALRKNFPLDQRYKP